MGDSRGDQKFSNISATTAAFTVDGGLYATDVVATWGGGTVKLEKLSADGTTYVTVATYSANTYDGPQYLPAGTYRFTVATASAIYIKFSSIVYV